jgi:Fe-S-cluster containining protein
MQDLVEIGKFGFRFTCQPGCTNCCRQPGEVWLTEEDRDRIAAHLGLSVKVFVESYCADEDELKLSIPASDSCHFLLEEGCSIHKVKPVQCRTYPFWPEHVRMRSSWKKLEHVCPGVGVGELLPVEDVRAVAQECADAFSFNPPVAPAPTE